MQAEYVLFYLRRAGNYLVFTHFRHLFVIIRYAFVVFYSMFSGLIDFIFMFSSHR